MAEDDKLGQLEQALSLDQLEVTTNIEALPPSPEVDDVDKDGGSGGDQSGNVVDIDDDSKQQSSDVDGSGEPYSSQPDSFVMEVVPVSSIGGIEILPNDDNNNIDEQHKEEKEEDPTLTAIKNELERVQELGRDLERQLNGESSEIHKVSNPDQNNGNDEENEEAKEEEEEREEQGSHPRRSKEWYEILGEMLYDGFSASLSIADIVTDVLVMYSFYTRQRWVFFYMSASIFGIAQLANACVVDMLLWDNLKGWQQAAILPLLLPLAPLTGILFLSIEKSMTMRRLLKWMKADIDSWVRTPEEREEEHLEGFSTNWFKEKVQSHVGFILEALVEAFPQSILQLIAIIYYSEIGPLSIISILLSMISVCSKTILISHSLDVYSYLVFWLSFVFDGFNLFCIVSWLFLDGRFTHTLTMIWMSKWIICDLSFSGWLVIWAWMSTDPISPYKSLFKSLFTGKHNGIFDIQGTFSVLPRWTEINDLNSFLHCSYQWITWIMFVLVFQILLFVVSLLCLFGLITFGFFVIFLIVTLLVTLCNVSIWFVGYSENESLDHDSSHFYKFVFQFLNLKHPVIEDINLPGFIIDDSNNNNNNNGDSSLKSKAGPTSLLGYWMEQKYHRLKKLIPMWKQSQVRNQITQVQSELNRLDRVSLNDSIKQADKKNANDDNDDDKNNNNSDPPKKPKSTLLQIIVELTQLEENLKKLTDRGRDDRYQHIYDRRMNRLREQLQQWNEYHQWEAQEKEKRHAQRREERRKKKRDADRAAETVKSSAMENASDEHMVPLVSSALMPSLDSGNSSLIVDSPAKMKEMNAQVKSIQEESDDLLWVDSDLDEYDDDESSDCGPGEIGINVDIDWKSVDMDDKDAVIAAQPQSNDELAMSLAKLAELKATLLKMEAEKKKLRVDSNVEAYGSDNMIGMDFEEKTMKDIDLRDENGNVIAQGLDPTLQQSSDKEKDDSKEEDKPSSLMVGTLNGHPLGFLDGFTDLSSIVDLFPLQSHENASDFDDDDERDDQMNEEEEQNDDENDGDDNGNRDLNNRRTRNPRLYHQSTGLPRKKQSSWEEWIVYDIWGYPRDLGFRLGLVNTVVAEMLFENSLEFRNFYFDRQYPWLEYDLPQSKFMFMKTDLRRATYPHTRVLPAYVLSAMTPLDWRTGISSTWSTSGLLRQIQFDANDERTTEDNDCCYSPMIWKVFLLNIGRDFIIILKVMGSMINPLFPLICLIYYSFQLGGISRLMNHDNNSDNDNNDDNKKVNGLLQCVLTLLSFPLLIPISYLFFYSVRYFYLWFHLYSLDFRSVSDLTVPWQEFRLRVLTKYRNYYSTLMRDYMVDEYFPHPLNEVLHSFMPPVHSVRMREVKPKDEDGRLIRIEDYTRMNDEPLTLDSLKKVMEQWKKVPLDEVLTVDDLFPMTKQQKTNKQTNKH